MFPMTPEAAACPYPACVATFHSSHLAVLFTWMLVKLTFANDHCSGLLDFGPRALQINTTGRKGEPTTSFLYIIITIFIPHT